MFAVVPLRWHGLDLIPGEWVMEFPPLLDFIRRFPEHWIRNDLIDGWVGHRNLGTDSVYYVRYDPKETINGQRHPDTRAP